MISKITKGVDQRKLFGSLVGISLFACCILFFTYAYYNWRSGNTVVAFDIEELSTECVIGANVNVSNIGPVLDYTVDGVGADFKVKNAQNSLTSVSIKLKIDSISDNLKVSSFKFALVVDKTGGDSYDYSSPVSTGDFVSATSGTEFSIALNDKVSVEANKIYSYRFIVYIDGNEYNDPSMQEGSLTGSIELGDCTVVRLLSDVPVGSYVAYTGNNGCIDENCKGENANKSDDNTGWCYHSAYPYASSGWRVAYKNNNKAHIVSAGALECLSNEISEGNVTHINYLNESSSKYCNKDYVDGDCIVNKDFWSLGDTDFYQITKSINGAGKRLASKSSNLGGDNDYCYGVNSSICGVGNDLIDIGGYYWFASKFASDSTYSMMWSHHEHLVSAVNSSFSVGNRPVISLSSTVYVTGGSGTEDDPYTIANKKKTYLNTMNVGDYVAYTGNNGCQDKSCEGQNANYGSNSSLGYCPELSSNVFTSNGWRIAYVKDETAYLVSGGAPECMCTGMGTDFSYSSYTYSNDRTSLIVCANYADTSASYQKHYDNLNEIALKYCNTDYAYNGTCDSLTARTISQEDFKAIDEDYGNFLYCAGGSVSCSTTNDLLNVGTYYWAGVYIYRQGSYAYYSYDGSVSSAEYNIGFYGVRPIIRLDSSVYVTGGTGTMDNPWQIAND